MHDELKNWFWATRKLPGFDDRKSLYISNISQFTIVKTRGFDAAENPTFEFISA